MAISIKFTLPRHRPLLLKPLPTDGHTVRHVVRESAMVRQAQVLEGIREVRPVADVLAATLKAGDTVMLDNLPAPKACSIRERTEAVGAPLLYLPAYSPDFNPIELAFAKLKVLLRSAAARTIPDLWDAFRRSLTRFTPTECRAYLAAAGYDAT